MKKKTIIKKAADKKAAASKTNKKPAAKHAPAKHAAPAKKGSAAKPASSAKKAHPAPAKKDDKHAKHGAKAAPVVAKAVAGKKTTPAPAPAKKVEAKKDVKESVKEKEVKTAKAAPAPVPTEKSDKNAKKDSKTAANAKKARQPKKDEEGMEDDFIADDDMGIDEIGEYEEELKAVETLDEETEEVVEWQAEVKDKGDEEVYLTDAEGRRYCRARDCDQAAVVDTYCRYHYLLFWKKIQTRKRILIDGKLERYIDELTARYPDKFLEMIRRDLRTEKDFLAAIQELEIDESGLDNEMEEDTQSFIEEVRGMGEGSSTGVDDEEF